MVGAEGSPALGDEQREVRTLHENPVSDQAVGETPADKDQLGRHEVPTESLSSNHPLIFRGRGRGSDANEVDAQARESAVSIPITGAGRALSSFLTGFRSELTVSTRESHRKSPEPSSSDRASPEVLIAGSYQSDRYGGWCFGSLFGVLNIRPPALFPGAVGRCLKLHLSLWRVGFARGA